MANEEYYQNGDNPYLNELFNEKEMLITDPSFKHSPILLAQEIDKIQTGSKKMIELHTGKPTKIETKVRLPVKEFPNFNFIGKIIGPKGATLKQLQEETGTKLIIQGIGSMRDKEKEEELRKEGGKYSHLHEDLHILIEAFGLPSECYHRISLALLRINEFFIQEHIVDPAKSSYSRRGASSRGVTAASSHTSNHQSTWTPSASSRSGRIHSPPVTTHRYSATSAYPVESGDEMLSVSLSSEYNKEDSKRESKFERHRSSHPYMR